MSNLRPTIDEKMQYKQNLSYLIPATQESMQYLKMFYGEMCFKETMKDLK